MIITGAGPSLEETIPLLREWGKKEPLGILAAASSAEALTAGGILPDLIISTDGGGWAPVHLQGALREKPPALAAALNAALPSQCGDLPILVLSDGSVWQNLLLKSMAVPFIPLPSRGTVTASAVDLALVLTRGEIFIAGTDLSHRDLRTHARPYSFNRLLELRASRLHPLYSETFVRAESLAASGSHGIYAAWFGRQLGAYPNRVHTLGNNNPVFNSLGSGRSPRPPLPGAPGTPKERFLSGGKIRRPSFPAEHALKTLLGALGDPYFAPVISGELSPLLLGEGEEPYPRGLKQVIRSLSEPYFPGRFGNG